MNVLIDGIQTTCETIELIEEDLIIGCHCAGGVHQEISGSSCLTITVDEITAEIINSQGEIDSCCTTDINDLFEGMGKTTIRVRHNLDNDEHEWIELMDNFF